MNNFLTPIVFVSNNYHGVVQGIPYPQDMIDYNNLGFNQSQAIQQQLAGLQNNT